MQINGTGQTAQMPQYKLGHETGRRRQLKTICRNQNEISKAQAAASQRKVEQLWPEKPGKIRKKQGKIEHLMPCKEGRSLRLQFIIVFY